MHVVSKAGGWNGDLKWGKVQNGNWSVGDSRQTQCMGKRWYRQQTHEMGW